MIHPHCTPRKQGSIKSEKWPPSELPRENVSLFFFNWRKDEQKRSYTSYSLQKFLLPSFCNSHPLYLRCHRYVLFCLDSKGDSDSKTWPFSYTNFIVQGSSLNFIFMIFCSIFPCLIFCTHNLLLFSLEGATTSVDEAAWDQIFHTRLGPFLEIPTTIPPIGPSEPKVFLELKEFRPCFVANSLFPSLQETWHLDLGHLNLTKYIATVLL